MRAGRKNVVKEQMDNRAVITTQNLDAAILYSITTDDGESFGFPVRLNSEPYPQIDAEGRTFYPSTTQPIWFFVCTPALGAPRVITVDEAVAANIKRFDRVSPTEYALWQQWLAGQGTS